MDLFKSIGFGAIAGLLLAVALLLYVGHERKAADKVGYDRCKLEGAGDTRDAIDDNLKAREQNDEIRQNRPDDPYYSDRWLHGQA